MFRPGALQAMQRAALAYLALLTVLGVGGIYLLTSGSLVGFAAGLALLALAYVLAKREVYERISARFGFVIYSPGVSLYSVYGGWSRVKVFGALVTAAVGVWMMAFLWISRNYVALAAVLAVWLAGVAYFVRVLITTYATTLPNVVHTSHGYSAEAGPAPTSVLRPDESESGEVEGEILL